ncbi:unnamed protein product, partial [marine sediment metagenome]
QMLLKLWRFGAIAGVHSSREIAHELILQAPDVTYL